MSLRTNDFTEAEPFSNIVIGAMSKGGGGAGNFNTTMDVAKILIVPQANEKKAKKYLEKKYGF